MYIRRSYIEQVPLLVEVTARRFVAWVFVIIIQGRAAIRMVHVIIHQRLNIDRNVWDASNTFGSDIPCILPSRGCGTSASASSC